MRSSVAGKRLTPPTSPMVEPSTRSTSRGADDAPLAGCASGIRAVSGDYMHLSEPSGAAAPCDDRGPHVGFIVGGVLGDDQQSASGRVVPGDLWRVARGRTGQ